MLMEDVLKHPTRVLSEEQRRRFFDDGCLVVEGLVDGTWLDRLHAAMVVNVESSRVVTESDSRFVLESGHSAASPRLRRLSSPVTHHADFWDHQDSNPREIYFRVGTCTILQ